MLKFLGGEGSSFRLDQDSAGRFISQITVGDHADDLVVGYHNNDDNYLVDNCWSIYI